MGEIDISKIPIDAVLTEEQKDAVAISLKGKVSVFAIPVKNDYKGDFDRGTILYDEKNWNYSFHKVIIPDGTVIEERNFTQKEPHTVAIEGKNLTFKECNLVNIELDPTWTVEGCNTAQIKMVVKSQVEKDGETTLTISHQVEQDGKFVEVSVKTDVVSNDDLASRLQRFNTVGVA